VIVYAADANILSAVAGAVVGAVATALATWWISARLELARERRRLRGALQVVLAELGDNRARILAFNESRGKTKEWGAQASLTLGDWATNKATVAALESMNERLWRELTEVYGRIYAAKTHRTKGLPSVDALGGLEDQLHEELDALNVSSLRSRTWRLRRYISRHGCVRRKLGSRVAS
jgi:hypothetical protein